MGGELRVRISEDDADSERLAELARYLRSELLELDVEDVSALSGGSGPPPGSRAFGAAEISQLGGYLGILTAVLAWYASFAGVTNITFAKTTLPVFARTPR